MVVVPTIRWNLVVRIVENGPDHSRTNRRHSLKRVLRCSTLRTPGAKDQQDTISDGTENQCIRRSMHRWGIQDQHVIALRQLLHHVAHLNPAKEFRWIRRKCTRWKQEQVLYGSLSDDLLDGVMAQ